MDEFFDNLVIAVELEDAFSIKILRKEREWIIYMNPYLFGKGLILGIQEESRKIYVSPLKFAQIVLYSLSSEEIKNNLVNIGEIINKLSGYAGCEYSEAWLTPEMLCRFTQERDKDKKFDKYEPISYEEKKFRKWKKMCPPPQKLE